MPASKPTSISGASSYREIGEYWDQHDLSEHVDATREVHFDVAVEASAIYFPVEKSLAEKLRAAAHDQGVSAEHLLNRWVQEHVADDASSK